MTNADIERARGIQVQVTLRIGDDDAGRIEFAVDSLVQFTDRGQAVIDGIDEAAQVQIQGIVSKDLETGERRRVLSTCEFSCAASVINAIA